MQNSSSSPPQPIRTEAPRIPDHEVLRCIGKGSYGEVWLARSLTGSLRAVKVVRREDFELDRTFEREFEGIMRFEPISRDHPGLVHILHVGRNDEEGFYYYVMELGDDRESGSRVAPGDYEPRTMGTDRSMKGRLPVKECVQHGIILADALSHLHEHGLTHRDIKPSNIIFVNGKPKLADIGLVAAEGQMTFVGTEGFVPPEGPGTASADIYSLGMVLYELSTGNDRLQFPELPNEPGNEAHRPMRRALNDVVCKACAPIPKKRFSTARSMADALRSSWRMTKGRRRWIRRLVTLPVMSGLIAFCLVTWRHGGTMPWPPGKFRGSDSVFLPLTGSVTLTSEPDGVDVLLDGRQLGRTPLTVDKIPAGSAIFTLRKNRYRDAAVSVSGISPGDAVEAEHTIMEFYDPPSIGAPWANSLKMQFEPRQTDHISRHPVSSGQFHEVVPSVMIFTEIREASTDGLVIAMARLPMKQAVEFCDELAKRDLADGYLPEGYCYRPVIYQTKTVPDPVPGQQDFVCFRIVVEKMGSVKIDSDPQGAAIFDNDLRLEVTPFVIPVHRTGPINLVLKKEGYKDRPLTGIVRSGMPLELSGTLERSLMPLPLLPWENSLGMKFKQVEGVKFSIWETRVQDYREFAAEENHSPGIIDEDHDGKSDIGQTDACPVVNVTRADAIAYCRWLTKRDRKENYLPDTLEYRLPTDAEWSLAAGINYDASLKNPATRHNRLPLFPWDPDDQYPPPPAEDGKPAAANLGDLTALHANALPNLTLEQAREMESDSYFYDDGYPYVAPVGQFRPNKRYGLYDLAGNVWEFVADDFGEVEGRPDPTRAKYAVTRGASWAEPVTSDNRLDKEIFYNQFRRPVAPGQEADSKTGFRVVLAPVTPKSEH